IHYARQREAQVRYREGMVIFMKEKKQKRFLPRGKRGYAAMIISVVAVILVSLLTLGPLSKAQLFQGVWTNFAHVVAGEVGSQSSGKTFTFPQQVATSSSSSLNGTGLTGSIDVTADFGSRQNRAYPIPYQFLGMGGIGMGGVLKSGGNYVSQANFRLDKIGDYDYMSLIFPTAASLTNASQQNWAKFDAEMTNVVSYHFQPIITLAYTPSWLEPQNQKPPQRNACLTNKPPAQPTRIKPMYLVNGQNKGPQVWGQLAALIVAHVDHNFPQLHAMYEIWNEPDQAQFMCVPDGDPN